MQFIARDNGLRLVEAPITVHYQDKPKRHVLAHGLLVLNGLLALVGQYRPLYYFGLLGLAVIGAAGLWSLWIAHIFRTTGQLAVGYALIAVILFLAGNTVLTTGIILHSVRGLLLRHLPAKSAASPAGDGSAP
jgi:apolipoprotein N-acyltransferase